MTHEIKIDGKPYLTCNAAAQLCACSMGYLRRLAREQRIPAVEIGRTWLLEQEGVEILAKSTSKMRSGFVAN